MYSERKWPVSTKCDKTGTVIAGHQFDRNVICVDSYGSVNNCFNANMPLLTSHITRLNKTFRVTMRQRPPTIPPQD